jgi:dihydroorotate dehydrogenase
MTDLFDFSGRCLTGLLRILPAELSHDIAMLAMEYGALKCFPKPQPLGNSVPLDVNVPGIGRLRHPIGLAAGFDKNARCPEAFEWMGLSFLEMGTVTPLAQPGNPKPRLFRQPETLSLINRMGFNSEGSQAVLNRLKALNWSTSHVPLGINIGKNKLTPQENSIDDFALGVERFASKAHWLTINISSPNTPGLRDLATPEFLRDLSTAIGTSRSKCWIKLDPDMDQGSFHKMISSIQSEGFQGAIISNTHRVELPEAGGQSGYPLLSPSNSCLEWAWNVTKGSLPMIASGGVLSGIDAFHKLARGACAVQIYTALVYRGPAAAARICRELDAELKVRGFNSAEDAINSFYL